MLPSIPHATVPDLLNHVCDQFAQQPCLAMYGSTTQTYAQLHANVRRMAGQLDTLGVQSHSRVLIMLENSPHVIHTWLAVNFINAIDVGINTGYRGQTLEHAACVSEAKLMVTFSHHLDVIAGSAQRLGQLQTILVLDAVADARGSSPAVAQLENAGIRVVMADELPINADCPKVSVAPADIASVIFTSGTTGSAKGVQMPHAQVCLLAQRSAQNTGLTHDDIFYSFYPMYHMAGKFMSVLATFSVGGKVVMDTSFRPECWLSRIRETGATATAAHGPMLEMVFAQPPASNDRDHALRVVRTAPFPKRIATQFEARFGVRGLEVWGMTEIGIASWSDISKPLVVGSCGRVDTEFFEFAVVDPATDIPVPTGTMGEFVVRPRYPWTIMQGYLGMPDKTVEAWRNLWFHTGDCGWINEDGQVFFGDRRSERIRRRAENISASDIEAVALEHPAIAEAMALGVDSGFESDDDILLCIVPSDAYAVEYETVLSYLAQHLPHYMVPRYLVFMESLPRTATGKLQRGAMRAKLPDLSLWDRKANNVSLRALRA